MTQVSPESAVPFEGQDAICCFCGLLTSDRAGGDGLRLRLSRGSLEVRQVLWAHFTCLSERMLPEFAGYLDDTFGSDP